jgi:hypothetical protein
MQCYSLEVAKSTEIESFHAESATLHEVINNLKAEAEHMKQQVIDAEGKSSRSSTSERKAYAQL